MAKKLKLSRLEHIALLNLRDEKTKGLTEEIINKLALYSMVDAHQTPGQASCHYTIAFDGLTYLQENPVLPPFKMNEKQAQSIVRLLGNAGIECAPPMDGSKFYDDNTLARNRAIQAVYKDLPDKGEETNRRELVGYELTEDGVDAFNATAIGEAYGRRIERLQKRDELSQMYGLTKAGKEAFHGAKWLKNKAIYMDKKGLPDYAKELFADSKAMERTESIRKTLESVLDADPSKDTIYFNEEGDAYRIDIRGVGVILRRLHEYGNDKNLKLAAGWRVGNMGFSLFHSDNDQAKSNGNLMELVEQAQLLIEACRLLNNELGVPNLPEPQNDSGDVVE